MRNQPIAWLAGFEIDLDLAPIEKVHIKKEIEKAKGDNRRDRLILIVRNPKEVFSRHGGLEITLDVLQGEGSTGNSDPRIYFNNIRVYNSWNPEKRLLIYYEDLVSKPIQTIINIVQFLNEPLDKIDLFMRDYSQHKKKAIKIYKESESKGNDLLYHSKLIAPDHRLQIDLWIEQLYPNIWNNYLKDRYSEDSLVYK